MKAVFIKAYGGNDVLETKEVSVPQSSPNQIIVQNHFSSINPFDVKIKAGYMKEFIPLPLPSIAGADFSGIVTQVGTEVKSFAVGDQVYGSAIVLNGGSGAFAETVVCNEANAAKKPTTVGYDQSAALVLVGVSAVQALDDHIGLTEGQKILIHGGAGGIGHIAVQIAKAKGAYVAATAATEDVAFVKELGADEVIDYKTENFEDKVKDFDAVFDTVSGETLTKSYGVLKKGGILVTMLGPIDDNLAKEHEIKAIAQMTQTNTDHLTKLAEYVDNGKIKVRIAKTVPLDDVAQAYALMDSHPKGKVVIEIKES